LRALARGCGAGLLALAGCLVLPIAAAAAADAPEATGLPLPRFVSLKSDRVNLRQGPGTDYAAIWVFRRVGLPVEVLREFEGWRQVRDSEGTTGWVLGAMLSGRRTVLVLPWDAKSGGSAVQLRDDDNERARPVARLEPGVVASVIGCDGTWCRISVDRYRGYVEQSKLWGVYKGEAIR
jgi:SH3-like domain-containing protein